MKMKIDEDAERKNGGLRALSKAQAEIRFWKSKFESEEKQVKAWCQCKRVRGDDRHLQLQDRCR